MKIEDISSVIYRVNIELYKQGVPDYFSFLNLKHDGYSSIITFMDIEIWSSEDDMRETKEDGTYEEMELYIRRMVMDIIGGFKKVSI